MATTPQDGKCTRKLAHDQLLCEYFLNVLLTLDRYALRVGQQGEAETVLQIYVKYTACTVCTYVCTCESVKALHKQLQESTSLLSSYFRLSNTVTPAMHPAT